MRPWPGLLLRCEQVNEFSRMGFRLKLALMKREATPGGCPPSDRGRHCCVRGLAGSILKYVKRRMLRRLYDFIRLGATLETTHGCRYEKEDTDNLGPTPDHDDCHAKAGWVAAGDNRGLRERRSYPLLPLPPGQPKGGKPGAR